MRISLLYYSLSIGLAALIAYSAASGDDTKLGNQKDMSASTTLLDVSIGKIGQRLILTRGPYLDPAPFDSVRVPSVPELKPRYYEVRAALKTPEGKNFLLAARLRGEDGTTVDVDTVVLDSLVEPGMVHLFIAEGSDLFVWRIHIPGGSCWTHFRTDKHWTNNAAPYRLDKKKIEASLGKTNDGRLSISVVEKWSGHTTYFAEKEKGALQFEMVRKSTAAQ